MGLGRASVPAHSHLYKHWLLALLKQPSYNKDNQWDSDEPMYLPTVFYLNMAARAPKTTFL